MATKSLIGTGSGQDATLIRAGSGWVQGYDITNTAAAVRYVKLYDKGTTPATADVPVWRIELAASGSARLQFPENSLTYGLGLGFRIVTGQADNDATEATAGDVVINLVYR